MIRNRILLKAFAVFFTLEILCNILVPSLSFALTSGPTSPEHTSFEPVDVTDMVNVSTGDFVYNLPLFEVPGPAGGFPISMSYHAGIQPEVDASWTGLGWTLNPGAINRTVDGAPDDFSNVLANERTFWEGGTTIGLSGGVTFGNGAVTAGLSFASDTYRGMSVGANVTVGAGPGRAGIGVDHTVDAYGNSSTKSSLTTKSIYQARFDQIEAAYDRVSGVSSISSAVKTGGSLLPVSYKSFNGKEGKIKSMGLGFNANIPIQQGLSVQLAGLFKRYWTNESTNSNTFGSLYFPQTTLAHTLIGNNSYDINDLYYLEEVGNFQTARTVLSKNPSFGFAGTFPTYDTYMVTGQGIGGSIRPYHLKANLYRATQRSAGDSVIVQTYPLGGNIKPTFRFINDFSNSFLYGEDQFSFDSNDALTFQFKQAKETTGDNSSVDGYVNGALAGSRSVKYFTKAEVTEGNASGLSRCTAPGYAPESGGAPPETIEAFKVTNESGVNYHYALPVYSYEEYSYSGAKDHKGKYSLNLFQRPTPYAYAWLLTAMTGPDYVDTNQDGIANDGDTGYWITFEYGKWSGKYGWRNPSQNFNKDLDRTYDFFSKGKKEIYYLNAIKSATHTALFVKELRRDGKGVVHDFEAAVKFDGNEVDQIDKGGYDPVNYGSGDIRHSTSTLRLKEILLLKNSDMPYSVEAMAQRGTAYNHSIGANTYHYGANVIDVNDIADIRNQLLQSSVRSVALDHDYSLAPETPNSFISEVDALNAASAHLSGTASGKLTLKAVKMKGKEGVSSLPDIKFGYDLKEEKIPANGIVTSSGSTSDPIFMRVSVARFDDPATLAILEPGDMIIIYRQGFDTKYAVVLSISGDLLTFQMLSGGRLPKNYIIESFQKTKNPPYNELNRDIWGFYKPDYADHGHENISRMVSEISAKTTDAWSLRTIGTITGADINIAYESDTYDNSIKRISTLAIKSVEVHNSALRQVKVYLHGKNAQNLFKPNNLVRINGVLKRPLWGGIEEAFQCSCKVSGGGIYFWTRHATFEDKPIIQVGENYVIVEDNALVLQLEAPNGPFWIDCDKLKESNSPGTGKLYSASSPWEFIGGDLQFNTNQGAFSLGGGLRVKEISVTNDLLNTRNAITYKYKQGVTPYEPLGLDVNIPRMSSLPDCLRDKETEAINDYRDNFIIKVAYRNMTHLFANARLMPGPGVMYSEVIVSESTTQSDGTEHPHPSYNAYRFEVFDPKLIDVFNNSWTATSPVNDNGYNLYASQPEGISHQPPVVPIQGFPIDGTITNTASVQDFSAVIGTLKSVTTYDLEKRRIAETTYQYLFDELPSFSFPAYRAKLQGYTNQGLIEEVFADAKVVRNTFNHNYKLIGLLTKFSQFPSIPVSTTSINYKTGVSQVNKTIAYDFYSGQVVKDLTTDAFGNSYSTEVIPAYRKYSAMEPTVSGGANMLVQAAGQKSYKVHLDPSSQVVYDGLLAASVETWSDTIRVISNSSGAISQQPGIWRKHSTYFFTVENQSALLPDGTYPFASFTDFNNWNNAATEAPGWQKNSTIRLYDHYSHELGVRDINGNNASTRMSSDGTKIIATVANARHYEAACSGAEDAAINGYYGGNLARLNGVEIPRQSDTDFTTTHTGQKALKLTTSNTKTFFYSLPSTGDKTYHVSVWVNSSAGRLYWKRGPFPPSIPAQPSNSKKAGGWYLLELTIPAEPGSLEIWCETASGTCHFDDFRVHPMNAAMASYVYNKWDEVSHILDNNNLYTEYRYDEHGRLTETWKESFDKGRTKTSKTIYHYAGQ